MRISALLAVLALPVLSSLSASAQISINAKSAILLDANTGQVIYKKNDTEQRAVASTQKLLTALIIAESGDLDKKVTIQLIDTQCEPFKLYIKPGQTYTRRQLLHALMIRSSNDVARALARDIDVPANRITEILRGERAITADTALRLGHRLKVSAEFWLNLQMTHDLEMARRHWRPVAA
jgi:addiction module HigA family antidote